MMRFTRIRKAALVIGITTAATGAAALAVRNTSNSVAQARAQPMVRLAVIEIDPTQLDAYKALLREEQEASVRLEPGVLMLHSVQIAADPSQVRLLEVYASRAAYEAHIRSPHFLKYKTATDRMVKSLQLIPTNPIRLCAKADGAAGRSAICI